MTPRRKVVQLEEKQISDRKIHFLLTLECRHLFMSRKFVSGMRCWLCDGEVRLQHMRNLNEELFGHRYCEVIYYDGGELDEEQGYVWIVYRSGIISSVSHATKSRERFDEPWQAREDCISYLELLKEGVHCKES